MSLKPSRAATALVLAIAVSACTPTPSSSPTSATQPSTASPATPSPDVMLGGTQRRCEVATWEQWGERLAVFRTPLDAGTGVLVTPEGGTVEVVHDDQGERLEYRQAGQPDVLLAQLDEYATIVAGDADADTIAVVLQAGASGQDMVRSWRLARWDRRTWEHMVLDEGGPATGRAAPVPTVEVVGGAVYWTSRSEAADRTDLVVRRGAATETLVRGVDRTLAVDADRLLGMTQAGDAMWLWDTAAGAEVTPPATWASLLPATSVAARGSTAWAAQFQADGRPQSELVVANDAHPARLLYRSPQRAASFEHVTAASPWVGVEDGGGYVLIDTRAMSYAWLDGYLGGFENGHLTLVERTGQDRYVVPVDELPALPACG